MTVLELVCTHLVAFAAGAATWWFLSRLAARRPSRESRMPSQRPPFFVTAIILAAIVVIGIGVQQAFYQRDATQRDECVNTWGQQMVDTITVRTDATGRLDVAQKAKDDALDNVVLVVIGLRAHPPTATTKDFDDLLQAFAAAKTNLDQVQARVIHTRSTNPYPQLAC